MASSSSSSSVTQPTVFKEPLVAINSENKILAYQKLGELFGLAASTMEQDCFEAAWEMCRARNWTLLRRCQEELNHIVNEQGRSLLQQAIRVGEIALATEMIANGIAIHVRDAAGNTAMHYAVQTESLDLISKLYEHISQDAQNFHGQTPLHFAAARGQLDIVRTLIANGANVSASTQVPIHDLNANASMLIGDLTLPNLTPLAFAAIRGDRDCVDLFLLENKRNPALNLSLRFGTMGNLVHLLITFHHNYLLKFLLQKHNEQIFPLLDERNARGLTPLMLAAYLGEEEALVLLRDKVNLEATDFLGRTAVHHAILGRQKKSLAYLHSFGVNLMVLDADNKIPLNILDGCDDAESLSVIGYLSNLCKHKAKTQHAPPNFIAAPPENLVFKGNDPTGLAYLGVIKTLEKNGDISGIRRLAGSSTGTLLAMLFAIGCTFEEMTSKTRFLSSFFDSPIADQAISEIPKSAPQEATLRRLFDIIQKNSLLGKDQFKTLHQLPSLCSGKVLLDWIEEHIYEKTGIHDCTFGELSWLARTNPQFKHLTIFTTRFGDTLTPSRFSSEDPFSDDIVISHAVCAALSIPGIYPLKILYTKNKAGGVDESPSLGSHGDAAMNNNFPLEAYDFEKFQSVMPLEEEAGAYFRLNKRTLGFALEAGGRNHSFSEMATVQECLEKVLELYCQMEPSTQQTTLYNDFRVVQFKNPTSLDRDLGFLSMPKKMQMHLMIQIGEEATMEFLEEQKRSGSSINPFLLMSERTNRGMKWTNLKSPLSYFVGRTQQIQTLKEKLISDISSTVSSSSYASSSSSYASSSSSYESSSSSCTSSFSSSTSSSCSTSSLPSQKRSCVVLAGAGGMGKSETAIAFAHQYRDNFSVVWWIETATPQSVDRSFRQLAEALDIYVEPTISAETIRQRIYHFLKTENLGKPYLLIFDNAEEVIELPQGDHGCILVTTTQPGHFFSEEILPIMPLTEDESITLIAGILKQEPNEEMKRLAAEVEYLPAILSQAAQYIRTTPGMTLREYLDLLSKEKIQVLSRMPVGSRYSKAQLSTWSVTHETLMHQYPIAYEWLEICAFLQPDAIPSSYLETWLENFKGEQSYVERKMKRDQILRMLVNSGILRYNEKSDSYSLHRIRQAMIKQLLASTETCLSQIGCSSSSSGSPISPANQKAISLLAAIINSLDLETTDNWLAFAPHEVQLCAILEPFYQKFEDPIGNFEFFNYKWGQGLSFREFLMGFEHPIDIKSMESASHEIATMNHLLGRWYLVLEENGQAYARFTQAQEIRLRIFPDDHPDIARTWYYLGKIFPGHYTIEAYQMRKRLHQDDHLDIADSLIDIFERMSELMKLADMGYINPKMKEQAVYDKYKKKAEEMQRRLYPNGHQSIALSLARQARDCLGHARATRDKVKYRSSGSHYYSTGYKYKDYGSRFFEHLDAAYPLAIEALEMLERIGMRNSPNMAKVLVLVGDITRNQRKSEESLMHYRRAIELYERISPNHDDLVHCYWKLCEVMRALGRDAEVWVCYDKLFKQKGYHEKSIFIRKLSKMLSRMRIQKDPRRQWSYVENVFRIIAEMDPTHDLGFVIEIIEEIKFQKSDLTAPIEVLTEYLSVYNVRGNEMNISEVLFQSGKLNCKLKKYDLAIEQFNRSLSMYPETASCSSPTFIPFLRCEIGKVYQSMGNHAEAVKNFKLGIGQLEKNDFRYKTSCDYLRQLVHSLKSLGLHQEALDYLQAYDQEKAFSRSNSIEMHDTTSDSSSTTSDGSPPKNIPKTPSSEKRRCAIS